MDTPEKQKPTVKQGANYKWDPKAEITITGLQFDYLQKFLQPYEILIKIKDAMFQKMVEDGIATEFDPETPEQ